MMRGWRVCKEVRALVKASRIPTQNTAILIKTSWAEKSGFNNIAAESALRISNSCQPSARTSHQMDGWMMLLADPPAAKAVDAVNIVVVIIVVVIT